MTKLIMARGKKRTDAEVRSWIEELVPILKRGTSLKNACLYLEIPYSTIRDYIENEEWVRVKIHSAEKFLDIEAETVIHDFITEKADKESAKWWLERSQKQKYSIRQEKIITGNILSQALDELEKNG